MKICFFLQRRFAYLGHAMAMIFKERYGINDFCGYVSMRSSYDFLAAQRDIVYSQLLLDEEVHCRYKNEPLDLNYLKNFEKEYGLPNLWPYICLDRVIRYNQLVRAYPYDTPKYSHEEMLRIFQVTAKAIADFLNKEKPDCVIFSVIGSIASLLLYQMSKKMGIKTLFLESARIGNKYFLSEFWDQSNYLTAAFENLKKNEPNEENARYREEANKFLGDFQQNAKYYLTSSDANSLFNSKSLFKKHFKFISFRGLKNLLFWLWRQGNEFLRNKNKDDYTLIKPWNEWRDKLNCKLRILIGCRNLYDKVNLEEDFAYFPLHTNPEAHPMLVAPFFMDQIWVIKQIARSLPAHFKLYVKDHPAMLGHRYRSYYKELKKIPNVKLIDPSIDSLKLIRQSKLVFTIIGTAGWEAVLLKKPVIVFGQVFYNILSMVKECGRIEDLPYLIKNQLENFKYNEGDLINLIAALLKESADFDLVKLWDMEGGSIVDRKSNNELIPFVDLCAKKLGLIFRK